MTSKCSTNKKGGTRGDSRECRWCCYRIVTSSVIYYWTDARQHGIYLFYIITKAFFISKSFKIARKPAFAPALDHFGEHQKISHLTLSIMYTNWSNLIGYFAQQRILIGPGKSRHCQTWFERRWASLVVEPKLREKIKIELKCKIYKSWRKSWKSQCSFCHQSSPVRRKAWTLPWILEEFKKCPRKTCGCRQPRVHLIRVF